MKPVSPLSGDWRHDLTSWKRERVIKKHGFGSCRALPANALRHPWGWSHRRPAHRALATRPRWATHLTLQPMTRYVGRGSRTPEPGMRPRRIAICTAQVPFTSGGAERHAQGLRDALQRHGYEAEIVAMPFRCHPPVEAVKNMLAWRLLDLTEAESGPIDLVVALRFPAYLVRHPRKVVWLIHQHRSAYDLWNSEYGDLATSLEGQRVRDI